MSSKHSMIHYVPPVTNVPKFQKEISISPRVHFAKNSNSPRSGENQFSSFENSPQHKIKHMNEGNKRMFSKTKDTEFSIFDLTTPNKPASPYQNNREPSKRRKKNKKCLSVINFR